LRTWRLRARTGLLRASLEDPARIGNRSREGGALGDIGDVYLSLGQYEKSLDLHHQALAIDSEVGYRFGEVWDHHDLGVIQFNLGNLTQAREELGQAIQRAKDINAPELIILSDNDLSTVLRNIGGSENLENVAECLGGVEDG